MFVNYKNKNIEYGKNVLDEICIHLWFTFKKILKRNKMDFTLLKKRQFRRL